MNTNRSVFFYTISSFIFAFAFAFASPADARSFRVSMLPNAPDGCNTCHTSGGGTPRNAFGLAVEALVTPGGQEAFWDATLAAADSDGDGVTNGQELGDPDGDGTADASIEVTHPGDETSFAQTQTGGTTAPPEVTLPTGDRGPIALDLDTTDGGDQGLVQTATNPAVGDQVTVDVVAVSGAQGQIGFSATLTYDETKLQFDSFDNKGNTDKQGLFFAGISPVPPSASGGSVTAQYAILGGSAAADTGLLGTFTFTVLADVTAGTNITLSAASYDAPVTVGSGGSFVVVGGVVFRNNIISDVAVVRSHNGADISWNTKFPGTNDVVTYNESGSTTTSTAMGALTAESTAHTVSFTGLTAATVYEYSISSTSTSGEFSPSTTGTFRTRATPDTRPVRIQQANFQAKTTSASFTWSTTRPATSQVKITDATDATVAESQLTSDGAGTHAVTVEGLTAGTTYTATLTSRGVGLDDLITEGLMTEADVTGTQTLTLRTLAAAKPLRFIRRPGVTRGTTTARIRVRLNQPGTVTIDYGERTSAAVDASSYPNSVSSTQASDDQVIELTGLTASTSSSSIQYRYRVTATAGEATITTDPSGTGIYNRDYRFRTKRAIAAPTITRGPQTVSRSRLAIFRWATNVETIGKVFVGTLGDGGTLGTADELEITDLTPSGRARLSRSHIATVTGLSPRTRYGYRIESETVDGQTHIFDPNNSKGSKPALAKQVVGSDGGFGTDEMDDTQLPLITRGPTVVNATESTLTLEWDTDEFATAAVNYGTAADALNDIAINGTPGETHRITLTGLTPATTYFYQISATDISGNGPVQSQVAVGATLTNPDVTAPAFSTAPAVSYTGDTRADIAWATNELSTGQIDYGLSATELTSSEDVTDLSSAQAVTLTGLTAGTIYFYQVSATDLTGNGPTQSEVLSFTTLATADVTAPTIADVVAAATDSAAVITWTTDEVANSNVQYGLTADALNSSTASIDAVMAHRIVLSNLTPETTYTYVVQSSDVVNNGPTSSAAATFTTAASGTATAPATPEGLAARAGNGVVQLTWNAADATAIGIVVERAEGEGDFTALATLDPTTAYLDNTAVNGTAYTYRITAQGLFQRASAASAATAAVTPAADAGPSAPTFSGIQGEPLTPTIIVTNSTPQNEGDTLTYTFQLSTMEDYSDVVDAGTIASGDGTTSYTVANTLTDRVKYFYRISSNDGFSNSPFLTGSFTVNASAPAYPGDLNGDLVVGFPDFLAFVAAFNSTQGQDAYNPNADLDSSGDVGFSDFLAFVAVFNKDYNVASGKPVIAFDYGQDLNAKFNLFGRFVQDAQERTLAVDVRLLEVSDIQGYGVELQYDPNALEFVSATDQGETFLNTGDRAAQLFGVLDHNPETGQLYIASSMATGASVSGGGTLATLTFKLIDPNPGNADINIAQGILFTPDQNANMAVNLGDRFNIMPTDYALDHNFPNPFNPETTIRYAIPEAGKVTLAVYNVLGQEVTRLVDADLLPGFYTVSWNGKDALGRGVASGIYLYRIQADNFTQTHKMLLLK